QVLRLIPGETATDFAVGLEHDLGLAALDPGIELDGIDDLGVARAAAQVYVDGLGDLVAAWRRIFTDEVMGAHRQTRDAKAALQAGGGRETIGNQRGLFAGQAVEGDDLFALGFTGLHGAGDDRFAADHGQATAALSLRRAAIFHRGDAAAIAQGFQ